MIVECPHCKTAHSKPERDVSGGAALVCRRCGKDFVYLAPSAGGGDTTPNTPPPAEVTASAAALAPAPLKPAPRVPVTDFHLASTEIRTIPLEVTAAHKGAFNTAATIVAGSAAQGSDRTIRATASQLRAQLDLMQADGGTPTPLSPERPQEDVRTVIAPALLSVASARPAEVLTGNEPTEPPIATPANSRRQSASIGVLESEISVPGTGLFFDEEPPRARNTGGETTTPRRGAPPGVAALPPFPVQALVAWLVSLWAFVLGQKPKHRVAIFAGLALVALVALGVLVAVLLPGAPPIMFLEERAPMLAGPGSEEAYPKVGELQRGEEVRLLAGGEPGHYVLVADITGRVGYVSGEALSVHRPIARAGVAFVGCRQSPLEPDADACNGRAQSQFDSCREVCGTEPDESKCLDQCQRQLNGCVLGCEGNLGAVATPGNAPVVLDASSDASADDAARADDSRGAAKPKKPVKKPKRPKKK